MPRGTRSWVARVLAGIGVLALIYLVFCLATGRRITRADDLDRDLERVPPRRGSFEAEIAEKPRDLIVVIADGIGFAHLATGRTALHGIGGATAWDGFEKVGWHRPHPIDGLLIDSAAAGTALATGVTTRNGFVGTDPEGEARETLLERATGLGYRTGVVTDSYVWDATAAAFLVHVVDRDLAADILEQLADSDVDVLFGELEDVGEGEVPGWTESEATLRRRFELLGPDPVSEKELVAAAPGRPLAAIFEEDQITGLDSRPNLPTLASAALSRLSATGDPFVLILETEEPDSASHRRDLRRLLEGLRAVEAVLRLAFDYRARHPETTIVFTGDHETGALAVSAADHNRSLRALWGSYAHTASPVPVMAVGPGAELFAGSFTTAEVGARLMALLRAP